MSYLQGGSYEDVKGQGRHGHHVYPFASYDGLLELTKGEGPAISMEVADHRKLSTTAGGEGSPQYAAREERRSLLEQGNFREAWMLDVKDIQTKFEDKYNVHLAYAERHLLELNKEKKIQLEDKFKEELSERQKLLEAIEKNQKEQATFEKQEVLEKQDLEGQDQLKQEAEKLKSELREQYSNASKEKNEIEVQKDSKNDYGAQSSPEKVESVASPTQVNFSYEEFDKDEFESFA